MAKLWSGLKKRLVVDIGSSAVRICELAKTKAGYEITKFAQCEYNSDPSLDEQQRKDARVQALRDAMKEVKVKRGKVILGVPGQSVFTRCRVLPPVPEYKVSQIVRYEIQQQIPFGLDQIAMDYQILSRTEQGGYDVMMAAIKVDVVEKHLEPLKAVKCSVASVGVLPLAAYNWMKHQNEFGDQGECVALVNIGASSTDIVIERGNQFRFTRPLNLGGNDVTRALAEAFNMDFVSAERIKRERAFAPTGDPKRDGAAGEVVGRVLDRLAGEIQRSFSYFRSQPGGGQVSRVILTGGGACLKNIVPYLRKRLDVEVRLAQTLANVQVSQAAQVIKQHPEQVCNILGMALGCCDTVAIDVNLIPPRILEVARRREQAVYWALSVLMLVLIFASVIPARARDNEYVKARIEEVRRAIQAYDPDMAQRIRPGAPVPDTEFRPRLEAQKRQIRTLETQVNALDRARNARRFWIDEISLISDARPAGRNIWFSSIETTQFDVDQQQAGQQRDRGDTGDLGRRGGRGAMGTGMRTSGGFPGLQPPGGAVGGGGARGAGGGRVGFGGDMDTAQGVPATTRGPHRMAGDVVIPRPNGMIVHGFAESDEAILLFREELERAQRLLPNNMYVSVTEVRFFQRSVNRVPWDILMNAPIDGNIGGRTVDMGTQGLYSFTIEVKLQYSRERPDASQRQAQGGDSR